VRDFTRSRREKKGNQQTVILGRISSSLRRLNRRQDTEPLDSLEGSVLKLGMCGKMRGRFSSRAIDVKEKTACEDGTEKDRSIGKGVIRSLFFSELPEGEG